MTRPLLLVVLLALLGPLAVSDSAAAESEPLPTVAIIGTGRVGSALGPRLAELGYPVVYGSRNPGSQAASALLARSGADARALTPKDAAAAAQILVLAVPHTAVEELLLSFGDLNDKIIIDCINAVRFRRQEISLVTPSIAATIARLAPGAHVVKTLNTTTAGSMLEPRQPGGTISMPLAGDDAEAKQAVSDLLQKLGFHVVDVGPLSNAPYLEAMGALYIHMNAVQGRRGDFEYRILQDR